MHRMFCWVIVCAATATSCGGSTSGEVVASASAGAATAIDAPATSDAPHGDHTPHHNGVVYMNGELHYEVVLDPQGHHRVYFSDATRQDLPAAAAASVTLTLQRPGKEPETLSGAIDQQGESWLLDGAPVESPGATVRVAFSVNGDDYWIDVPFITAAQ